MDRRCFSYVRIFDPVPNLGKRASRKSHLEQGSQQRFAVWTAWLLDLEFPYFK